ncbi:hypothetical protein K501DRAFT_284905 [Backusella circina FSU 941]|nr:hypothetical protein K501DRAFT_284905 [Backusella circina FSU 941]
MTSALSFELGSIKEIVIKLLPKSLGRNSLVEAEIELKQQISKAANDDELSDYENLCLLGTEEAFPTSDAIVSIQEACSHHCSLADKSNQQELKTIITVSPIVVIYVTAVVEHIAEYVLNLVAKTADQVDTEHIRVKEVLAALLDDIEVTELFRQMSLKDKLEKRASVYPSYCILSLPSPASSPVPLGKEQFIRRNSSPTSTSPDELSPENSSKSDQGDDENDHRPRVVHSSNCSIKSSESVNDRPLSIMSNGTVKSSGSKSRFKFFGIRDKRNSITLNFPSSLHIKKTSSNNNSPSSTTSPTSPPTPLLPLATDFDDLIRSGNTRKVTLTPNRLRSIEIKESTKLEAISTATPWEKLTTPIRGRSFKKSSLDSPPPPPTPPLPPLPRIAVQQQQQQQQPSLPPPLSSQQQVAVETSPPLTPASSVASRPSQRSRHSIISEEKSDRPKSATSSTKSQSSTNEEILVEETTHLMKSPLKEKSSHSLRSTSSSHNNIDEDEKLPLAKVSTTIEKPSVILSKRTSLGSRPSSFHESAINSAGSVDGQLMDGIKRHSMKQSSIKRKSVAVATNGEKKEITSSRQQEVVYIMPGSPILTRSSLSNHALRNMGKDKASQTQIEEDTSGESIEGDEEWFIQEDDWNDSAEEEKAVAEWLLGNV